MVTYSIAMCNYNMSTTIEDSVRSILDQIDERYEVVIIDDGSDDGSVGIITSLADEYDNLRYELLEFDPSRKLNGTRQIAVEKSRGEYVFVNMDTDDVYEPGGIQDFATIYHELEAVRNEPFFLKGYSIDMAPKDLLLEIPYRNIGRGGDKDLWRRLFANEAIVWLEHDPFWRQIGYFPEGSLKIRNGYDRAVTDFKSGITFWSYVSHHLREALRPQFGNRRSGVYQAAIAPIAYLQATRGGRLELENEFKRKRKLKTAIRDHKCTLPELESMYGFEVDREQLSEVGRKAFLPGTESPVEWKSVL